MQTVIINAEVVSNFVDNGHGDFPAEFVEIGAHLAEGKSVNEDAIRHSQTPVLLSLGQRYTVVETKQVGWVPPVGGQYYDILHQDSELSRQRIKGLCHQLFKLVSGQCIHDEEPTIRCSPTAEGTSRQP
jgi:hypothetical protein